jgi:hypothetical protein
LQETYKLNPEGGMLCRKVLNQLSGYIDEVLEANTAVQVFQHLEHCENCRKEFEGLSIVRQKLKSLPAVQTPEYLRNLIQIRLSAGRKEPISVRIRNLLERRWSIIRTTEGIWYWTRALGTVMTTVFFLLISSVVTPYYMNVEAHPMDWRPRSPDYRQQVLINVPKKLGMHPVQAPSGRSNPAINDLYFLKLEQSAPSSDDDDNLSVVTAVDTNGTGTIQGVIEYPRDKESLNRVNEMITTARFRPASKNGQAVSSQMVIMYTKISVSN